MTTPPASITLDDSCWPLLVVRFVGTPTLAQFDTYLRQRTSYLLREELHVTLSDARTTPHLGTEYRQRLAEWMTEHARLFEETVVGTAMVFSSPFLRLMLSTLLPLRASSIPYYVAARPEAAALWCAERLEETGLLEPAERIREQYTTYRLRASG